MRFDLKLKMFVLFASNASPYIRSMVFVFGIIDELGKTRQVVLDLYRRGLEG